MAITYPLSTPTSIGIAKVTLAANNAVAVSQSPFTFKQQVIAHQGQRWSASVSIPPVRRDLAEPWVSFLMSLKGQVGTFLLGDPNCKVAQGVIGNSSDWFLASGTWDDSGVWDDSISYAEDASSLVFAAIKVNGTQSAGTESLLVKGLQPSTEGFFYAGDYIQLGSGSSATLHKVLQQVDSDLLGEATLEIWPKLRKTANDDDTIVVENAVGVFRLVNSSQSWDIDDRSAYGISFDAVEAIT